MSRAREGAVRRQELRRSNAAVPHRNRFRELKVSGRPEDFSDVYEGYGEGFYAGESPQARWNGPH